MGLGMSHFSSPLCFFPNHFLWRDLVKAKGAFTLIVSESVSELLTEFCLHYIRGSDPRLSEAMAILIACSSNHVHRRLSACALHNLRRTGTSASEEIATCSDELGHGSPRQKSRTRTRISVNTKHQFTCFDCVRARTRMLGPRFRL